MHKPFLFEESSEALQTHAQSISQASSCFARIAAGKSLHSHHIGLGLPYIYLVIVLCIMAAYVVRAFPVNSSVNLTLLIST